MPTKPFSSEDWIIYMESDPDKTNTLRWALCEGTTDDEDFNARISEPVAANGIGYSVQIDDEEMLISWVSPYDAGYGVIAYGRSCALVGIAQWQAFENSGGGGMTCEQLRECTIDFLDETPLIAEEEMLRDDEDFILWQYKPPETYNEILENPFDIPFRRMSDIVAMLQVIHYQLNEIIVIQRSEVVGAAFPEWNQVRIENRRPVGIFQACELLPDGKLSGAHYQIQIPWMIDNPEIFLPQVFWIEAGSIQYLRVFEDNSRICLYVATEEEGLRVVDILTALMDSSKNQIYTDRPTPVRGGTVEEKYKILKYLSYYEGGIKKTRGKWSRLVLDAANFEYPAGFTPVES